MQGGGFRPRDQMGAGGVVGGMNNNGQNGGNFRAPRPRREGNMGGGGGYYRPRGAQSGGRVYRPRSGPNNGVSLNNDNIENNVSSQ
jgi:hypothetical protein